MIEINENLKYEEKNELLEKNKIIDEENQRKINPTGLSLRINEYVNISEMFDCVALGTNKLAKNLALTIWDSSIDSDNSFAIDIALGIKANNIILNAFNLKTERMIKINKYLDIIDEYY